MKESPQLPPPAIDNVVNVYIDEILNRAYFECDDALQNIHLKSIEHPNGVSEFDVLFLERAKFTHKFELCGISFVVVYDLEFGGPSEYVFIPRLTTLTMTDADNPNNSVSEYYTNRIKDYLDFMSPCTWTPLRGCEIGAIDYR